MNEVICKSCAGSYQGNFCPQCGQENLNVPFKFRSLVSNVTSLFDFDRGFIFTFISLIRKPGWVINQYLGGNTKPFTNPVRFLFTTVAAWLVIIWIRRQLFDDVSDSNEWRLYAVLLPEIPILAACNALVVRSRNFAEHLMITTYELAQFITIIAFSGIFEFLETEPLYFFLPALIVYHVWFNLRVFSVKRIYLIILSIVSIIVFFATVGLLNIYIPQTMDELSGN